MKKNVDQQNRAIQFQRFATLLLDELRNEGYTSENKDPDDIIYRDTVIEHIARRAYDFATHVSLETAQRVRGDVTYYRDDEEVVDEIPDMYEFSEQLYY